MAAMSSSELSKSIGEAKILDPRITLQVNVEGANAQVAMFVNPNTNTFEADCKDSALSIAKAVLDADHDLKKVAIQFKSYRSKDFKQIDVSQSDLMSFNDGSLSKDDFLQKLELKTVVVDGSANHDATSSNNSGSTTSDRMAVVASASVPGADHSAPSSAVTAVKPHRDPQDKFDRELAAFRAKLSKSTPISAGSDNKTATEQTSKTAGKNSARVASVTKPTDEGMHLSKTYDDKNHLYKSEWMAFYYPEDWTHQRSYKNFWATPDERDIAQFVSKATPGAAVTAALYIGLSLEQKLDSEEKLAAVYDYEIIPRNVKIGYEEKVPAISLESVRKGQNGEELFFRRIYFMVGRQLCSLTLSCMNTDQQKMNTAFASLLATIHSAHK
jgi:hypothetical protein